LSQITIFVTRCLKKISNTDFTKSPHGIKRKPLYYRAIPNLTVYRGYVTNQSNSGQVIPMKIKLWGTRGSIPISNTESVRFGGNTTSVAISSECIPPGEKLVIDTGSGFVPFGFEAVKQGGLKGYNILYTHYHHDHTMGLLLAPPTFIEGVEINVYGPVDHGYGPKNIISDLMKPPKFPVDFREVGGKFNFIKLEYFESKVIIVHPKGGFKVLTIERYEKNFQNKRQIAFSNGAFDLAECMVIKMRRANHPDLTLSYRFEENPTGKVFVFLTDHEDVPGISQALKSHVKDSDLLIADAQYDYKTYKEKTAGYGHGTPTGCIQLATVTGVKKLGLTHHDPNSTDEKLENVILKEALESLKRSKDSQVSLNEENIFICWDYQEIVV